MALSAKVPTKSVKNISKDFIKTDQKKTHTAKRKDSYESSICSKSRLTLVFPDRYKCNFVIFQLQLTNENIVSDPGKSMNFSNRRFHIL